MCASVLLHSNIKWLRWIALCMKVLFSSEQTTSTVILVWVKPMRNGNLGPMINGLSTPECTRNTLRTIQKVL